MAIAINNPASFKTAFLQLATTSLTLDPAQKLAYLVPRDERVILDVSYLGLIKMAIEAQMCKNLIIDLVFEKISLSSMADGHHQHITMTLCRCWKYSYRPIRQRLNR
ncbi:hypothetical protein J4727_00305 [Providencia rettgeri]|uniref:Uncharacterized protein n=1 Tax=Providencia rettgeri TaxID=587 RepID=A0A939NAY5_PRORE|nr:hypothetical protein [Providencia rettgeri]